MESKKESHLLIIGFVGALLLSGCVTFKPNPLIPEAEIESIQKRGEGRVELPLAPGETEKYFPVSGAVSLGDGLTLSEANALALFYSPKILGAKSEYHISEAMLLGAGVAQNPQIFLGPRLSTRDSGLIFPASLAFQLPILNEHGLRKESATRESEKHRWLLLEMEIEVLASIQKHALQIDANRALEQISARQAERSRELITWVESLYSGGEIDSFSLQVAQREYEDAKSELMNARLRRRKSERGLLARIGLIPDSQIEFHLTPLPLLSLDVQEFKAHAILSHPSLKALEQEYQAAEHTLQAEVRGQFPHIQFGPEFESDRGESTIGIGFGIEIPIFARNRTKIAVAEQKRNQIRNKYHKTLLQLLTRRANLADEHEALDNRLKDLRAKALRDAKEFDKRFSNSLPSTDGAVLEALGAADSLAHTLSEEVELRQRMGSVKIDFLLVSAVLIPKKPNQKQLQGRNKNEH